MKKTYMIPTMKVVKIQPAQFIANSLPTSEDSADPELGMSARSSRFSRWEEDDYEEE